MTQPQARSIDQLRIHRWALRGLILVWGIILSGDSWTVQAGDWPQILGPQRNGQAEGEQLLAEWPAEGPKQLWQIEIGSGYAGPAIVDNRVVIFHRVGDRDVLDIIAAETGQRLHRVEFAATYSGGVDPDTGPRCVPTVHQGVAYLWSAAGDCHAVELATGKTLWSRNLLQDYRGDLGYFGCGSAPIVAGDRLLVNVGSREDAGIVALELDSGKTAWTATDEQASYAAPTLNRDNQHEVVFVTRLNLLSIDARNGRVSARVPFGQRGPTVNAAVPIWAGDQGLFVTASYGVGARMLGWSPTEWKQVWKAPETLSSQYNTPLFADGALLGIHGREDVGMAELRCVAADSGRVLWSQPKFGVAHLLQAGPHVLALNTTGELILLSASQNAYTELARRRISEQTTRALPALSNGRLVVRSNSGETGTLSCWQVGR